MSKYNEIAVTIQPGYGTAGQSAVPDDWMPPPTIDSTPINCPRGLEHLAILPEININQIINCKELCCGCEANQKYDITHPETDKKLYQIKEDSTCCKRFCCRNGRPLEMSILDHAEKEVIHVKRPFRCAGLMCGPWLDEFTVTTPDGNLLGMVKQTFAWCVPKYNIYNANGEVVLWIKGPSCYCSCGSDIPFKIYAAGKTADIGVISKIYTGCAKECCTEVDNFRIAFPPELDVRMRAVLLAACFSIDLMFYEGLQ